MSTVFRDVTPCSLVEFCQCVFLIILLFRLLRVAACVRVGVLETNNSRPALIIIIIIIIIIIMRCPFNKATIRKIEGSILEFFIDIFLPAVLVPWNRLSL